MLQLVTRYITDEKYAGFFIYHQKLDSSGYFKIGSAILALVIMRNIMQFLLDSKNADSILKRIQ